MLIRLARQSEVTLGKLVEKESHGRKLLIVSHPKTGSITVMDAHCFHMGTPLVGGDIEDFDGHVCVVCPAHRYRIDAQTGHQIESDLCGNRCSSEDQKQRVYNTHCDGDYIWVDMPDIHHVKLPSDYYNQLQHHHASQKQYGLLGPSPASPRTNNNNDTFSNPPVSPLQPYAGLNTYPIVPGQPSPTKLLDQQQNAVAEDPPLVLSQEETGMDHHSSPYQFTTSPVHANTKVIQSTTGTTSLQGRIQFPSVKADAPHIARRKAATAAILARSYKPPTSDAPLSPMMVSPSKLVGAQEPQFNRGLSSVGGGGGGGGGGMKQQPLPVQRTLFQAWGMAPGSIATAAANTESMDMS